jgi:TRAP-type C4-dicarboxylate transport system permease small subunit
MPGFLAGSRSVLAGIGRVERWVTIVMMATMVTCIFAQVVSRYFFGQPLVWVEELSTYAFIWGTFIGASAGLKAGRHIRILSFLRLLAPGTQLVFRGVTDLVIGLFCVLLVINGVEAMMVFEWRQRTIALPIELPRYLFYSTPLILGSASMVLTVAQDLLEIVARGRRQPGAAEAPLPL